MLKTLIINGSPRINGDTASLLDVVKENIEGEYKVVDAYRCSISPCLDCRFCWENNGCAIINHIPDRDAGYLPGHAFFHISVHPAFWRLSQHIRCKHTKEH